ncbi:flagellar motor switch protein FliG (plasmid) [Roseivivax marinus]|uniref:flagellar motor switch protein FliG n=1 Tax=Roseivivax marinus TaxID=1379903 RepID=UPI001F036B0F|nr:flagellar motor switch protein FliG [Roseivivax marinus]UMA66864.1 flagellar motor switch protein FliG [Roseivivax marinus]
MSTATLERSSTDVPDPRTSRSKDRLKGPEKAAVLFLCLGEDRGTELMKRLSEDEIRKISHAMAGLGVISAPSVEMVMREFGEAVAHGGSVVGSFAMAESMLRKVLPEDQVTALLREIRGPLQERDLWARFSSLNETSIANYLRAEHDQTAAAILANIETQVAATVLPLLGRERMVAIIERMIALDAVPQHMMKQIEETLSQDISVVAAQPTASEKQKRMADLFNRLDHAMFEELAPDLEERMPETFPKIRQKMFTFDDLARLDVQGLVRVMRGVEGNTLPLALKGAKPDVLEYFFAALPQRSRDMLQDELSTMGAVRSSEVRAAQAAMLECARALAADDVIVLPTNSEDEFLVE